MNRLMKKSLTLLSLTAMMTAGTAYAAPNEPAKTQLENPITVHVGGEMLAENGFMKPGAAEPMLPLRAVTESLGFTLTWNPATYSVDLAKDNVFTTVTTGEDRYTINKRLTTLGTAPELVDSKLHVPVTFVSKIIRGTVASKGSSVAISMKEEAKKVQSTGVITAIRTNGDNAQIQIQGIGTEGIVFNVDKDTVYQMLDGTKLSLADLHAGLTVSGEHSMIMTMSLPPQTPTSKVTVLDTKLQAGLIGTAGVIAEVRSENKEDLSILVKGQGLTDSAPDEVVLQLTKDTAVVDKNGDKVGTSALVKGANVIGFYGPALTKSLPPIGTAWKIVVGDKEE
ncbi:copper amine oxidase N-terminal domain-containing protein [Paenibacillus sp. GCM10023248]|uniref:copper amine oxidase N-terminal domain-containing protein n=1 Tax=unclassified Paenibacillus TaxID=185978 RepID=UPI0023790521|nr:copper amine oxidase N-terminal domain-containing protein [Paenibacillus sp. MAHUQ-63]MDD9270749.1 copper amine oxidase N-terminal domain-containing protein [Paenibacillus sp. MAHUQ-63]